MWRLILHLPAGGNTSDSIVPPVFTGVFPNLSESLCGLKRNPNVKFLFSVYSAKCESLWAGQQAVQVVSALCAHQKFPTRAGMEGQWLWPRVPLPSAPVHSEPLLPFAWGFLEQTAACNKSSQNDKIGASPFQCRSAALVTAMFTVSGPG